MTATIINPGNFYEVIIEENGRIRHNSMLVKHGMTDSQAADEAIFNLNIQHKATFTLNQMGVTKNAFIMTTRFVNRNGKAYTASSIVFDSNGEPLVWTDVYHMMDEELREDLEADCSFENNQEFFEFYSKEHVRKFDEDFAPYVGGAW